MTGEHRQIDLHCEYWGDMVQWRLPHATRLSYEVHIEAGNSELDMDLDVWFVWGRMRDRMSAHVMDKVSQRMTAVVNQSMGAALVGTMLVVDKVDRGTEVALAHMKLDMEEQQNKVGAMDVEHRVSQQTCRDLGDFLRSSQNVEDFVAGQDSPIIASVVIYNYRAIPTFGAMLIVNDDVNEHEQREVNRVERIQLQVRNEYK